MDQWMSGVWAAAGADVHYERTGGAEAALVLLHGLTGNGACWRPVAQALQDAFDVVMPDARGHGQSSTPSQGYRYDDHAQDVAELIRGLELRPPVLVGHSMGGMTAAVIAGRADPPLGGLILVDPTFLSPARQREVYASDVLERHRHLLLQDRAAVTADLCRRHPHRSEAMVACLAQARLQTRVEAFEVLRPPNPDFRQLLRSIRVPMLLVIGDAPVVSMEMARELQGLTSGRLRVEQIAHAGHGVPYDQPERLASIIRSFATTLASDP